MQHAAEGQVYCISILENFSRSILASGLSRRQDLPAYLLILYEAIRKCGCPEALVSDHGGVFLPTKPDTSTPGLALRSSKSRGAKAGSHI